MTCVYCGEHRPAGWFLTPRYAQCVACWLRANPQHIEPLRAALAAIDEATR